MKRCFPCILAMWLCGVSNRLAAETIQWFSDGGRVHLDSGGGAMDEGFFFELGVFEPGFVPTPGNMAAWDGSWVAAGSGTFVPASQRFAGQLEVTENPSPFAAGAEAWILGRRETAAGSERILFRSSNWLWPTPNPMNPFSLEWNAKDADIVVVGEIHSSGTPFLMKSASMETIQQTVTWEDWRLANLADEPLDGPTDDPDEDGTPNILEFAFGSLPQQAGPPPATPVEIIEVNGQGFIQITVPRRDDHGVDLTIEVSSDLLTWHSGSAHTEVILDTPESLKVRDKTALPPTGGRRFIRVAATLPAE